MSITVPRATIKITINNGPAVFHYQESIFVSVDSLSRVVVTGVRPTVMDSGPDKFLGTARGHDR